jgi:hypothetical protein
LCENLGIKTHVYGACSVENIRCILSDACAAPGKTMTMIPDESTSLVGEQSTSHALALPPRPSSFGRNLWAWLRQGWRVTLLRKPDWHGLQASPAVALCLMLLMVVFSLLTQRIYIKGSASFYGAALHDGWFPFLAWVWVCWLLVPRVGTAPDAAGAAPPSSPAPHTAAMLYLMFAAQFLVFICLTSVVFILLAYFGEFTSALGGNWFAWGTGIAVIVWQLACQWVLVSHSGVPRRSARRWVGAAVLLTVTVLSYWFPSSVFWYPDYKDEEANTALAEPRLALTQELLELQPQILQTKLQALGASKPDRVNVYAITFAPYGEENVFQKESELVAGVMQERFGAQDKSIQLVNNPKTARDWPWATPRNLQRTIQRISQVMNKDEDVLFIHLTSHGARDGQLSAHFWPLEIDPITPAMLKGWLDEAGIRFRVVSVSACYSGSWIEPLSTPHTLIMTAADAEHTSFGCGKKSDLTFFGRAMFDEQLRQTHSFEKAHANARTVIEQRELEAGKTGGYSNPQIRVGAEIATKLAAMEAQLAKP